MGDTAASESSLMGELCRRKSIGQTLDTSFVRGRRGMEHSAAVEGLGEMLKQSPKHPHPAVVRIVEREDVLLGRRGAERRRFAYDHADEQPGFQQHRSLKGVCLRIGKKDERLRVIPAQGTASQGHLPSWRARGGHSRLGCLSGRRWGG